MITLDHQRAERCAAMCRGTHWHTSHHFDTAANGDIIGTTDDALRGKVDSLLARTTLAINRCSRDGLREACGKNSIARHIIRLLTNLTNAASDHVVYERGINIGTLYQCLERLGEQVNGMPIFQPPI